MANTLQARLRAIEASVQAKQAKEVSKSEQQRIDALRAELEALSDEELATRFQEMLNQPPSSSTQVKLEALKGLSDQEVIDKYFQFIREEK